MFSRPHMSARATLGDDVVAVSAKVGIGSTIVSCASLGDGLSLSAMF